MRNLFKLVLGAALLAAVPTLSQAAGCSGGLPGQASQHVNSAQPSQAVFNAAVLHYLNVERCQRGLSPLQPDAGLLNAAAGHSRNMAKDRNFSHQSRHAGMRDLPQRLKGAGVSFNAAGENIAMEKLYVLLGRPISAKMAGKCQFTYTNGQAVPMHSYASLAQEVVQRLMASPKHRANILNARFQRAGSGLGVDPAGPACGDIYITQDFAS